MRRPHSPPRLSVVHAVGGTALLLLVASACSESSEDGGFVSDDAGAGTGGSTGTGGGSSGEPLPPEQELEETFRSPVVTGAFVWSANPDSNRVARVDARTLQIDVFDAGHAPTFLAALPQGATEGGALVINSRSNDASIFLMSDAEATSPELSRETVPLQPGASGWAVGKTGRVAVAWSRPQDNLLGLDDGYQDITVLTFDGAAEDRVQATSLAVGFRPSRVVITADETRGFVVSDPGITVLGLSGAGAPAVERELFLPEAELGLSRDVSFSADGQLAFVRLEGESELLIVNVTTDARSTVSLPAVVTDLDLSQDGSFGMAVLRGEGPDVVLGEGGAPSDVGAGQSQIVLFSVDALAADPGAYDLVAVDDVVGSAEISANGEVAALYTNAQPSSHLWILELDSRELRQVDVHAPLRAALLSGDGAHAITLMKPPVGSSKAGAFAVVPLLANLPARIEGTSAEPAFVSIASDGSSALITTLAATGPSSAYLVQLPGLRVDVLPLPSKPLASGMAFSANKGFIAQEHPEGRMTFVELSSGVATTVTGFELGSKVVE